MVEQSLGRLWFYLIMVEKRDKTITLFWTWWICVMHSAYVLRKTKIRMMDTFCPYWFAKHQALQLPLRSYLTYNNGKKKNLWMKVLSIKGKKVKTSHREKGDRHDQNAMLLILKEIKWSQDVLSLTFFSFFATNPRSKCQKLIFYWWSIINFASIETASFFSLLLLLLCLRHDSGNWRGKKAHTHEWWLPCNIPMQSALTSQIPFSFIRNALRLHLAYTLHLHFLSWKLQEETTSGYWHEGMAYVESIYRESDQKRWGSFRWNFVRLIVRR